MSASPDQNSSAISHQVSAPNSDQKSTGKEGEPNKHNEPDEPIQEASWYDIPGVHQEPEQNGNDETEIPIQEVSWYAIPGVPENEIPPSDIMMGTRPTQRNLQENSVKPEPSDIMMGTMPTQRKFNLTKAKGKGQRAKTKEKKKIILSWQTY